VCMIDAVQVILLLVIVTLAILLVILGVQVFFILRELRRTVTKANKVLDDTGAITRSVSGPLSSVATLVEGVSTGAMFARVAKIIIKTFSKNDDEKKNEGGSNAK